MLLRNAPCVRPRALGLDPDGRITLKSTKTKIYGFAANGDVGIGVGPADQKVALVRVPNFGMLAVTSGVMVTTSSWNGLIGG